VYIHIKYRERGRERETREREEREERERRERRGSERERETGFKSAFHAPVSFHCTL
jgi:hypothetical protein